MNKKYIVESHHYEIKYNHIIFFKHGLIIFLLNTCVKEQGQLQNS